MENIEGHWIDVNDSNSKNIYVGYYDLGLWYSKDHGKSWKNSIPNNTTYPDYSWWAGGGSNCNFVVSDPVRENIVWAAFSADQPDTKSAIFKSTEGGENWKLSNSGLKLFGLTTHGLSIDYNSDSNNRVLFVTQEGEVYKSTDDGKIWIKKSKNMTGVKFTEVDKKNSQLIYAGGESGFWRSPDGGENWTEVGLQEMRFKTNIINAVMRPDIVPNEDDLEVNPPIVAWQGVFEIVADPNIKNRVYVVAYGKGKGLYRSDDAGTTWKKLYTNDFMRGVAITKQNSNIIYASSSYNYHSGGYSSGADGILVSYQAGKEGSWKSANEGMAWKNGGHLDIETGTEPNIWAWSPGTGTQHSLVPNFTLAVDDEISYTSKILIYPNPTQGKLQIDMTRIENFSIATIYSITGQKFKQTKINGGLINSLDISSLQTGIYYLTISTDMLIASYKLIKQ